MLVRNNSFSIILLSWLLIVFEETCENIYTDEKTYSCNKCTVGCSQESSLKKHITTHSDEKPYPCNQCIVGVLQESSYKKHIRTHIISINVQ